LRDIINKIINKILYYYVVTLKIKKLSRD